MTLFFVFRLAFATYPCCWKENWKKFKKAALDPLFLERYLYGNRGSRKYFSKKIKKIWTIWGFFGKILVWSIQSILQAYGKKNQKKSEKIRRFPNFSGRYLVKAKVYQRWQRQFFAKKFKKIPPMGRFLERYLFRRRPGFLLDRKKNWKKFKIFRPLWIFSGRYLYEGRKRDQQYFPCREGKKWEKWKKIRPLPDFRRRYLVGAIRWQL